MAAINSTTFSAGSGGAAGVYAPGDQIGVAVNFTPDTPSVVVQPFTLTTVLTNAAGTQVATSSAPFEVHAPQPGGDKASAADDGNRTWAEGAVTPQADGSLNAEFSSAA